MSDVNYYKDELKKYEPINSQLDVVKFLYLKTINNYEIDDDVKQRYFDKLTEIARALYQHKNEIDKKVINESNADSFEKGERAYVSQMAKVLTRLVKEMQKVQTVKIKLRRVDYSQIDNQLSEQIIIKEYHLSKELLLSLNSFRDQSAIKDNQQLSTEMLKIKSDVYLKKLQKYEIENGDIFYRVLLRMKKLIGEKRIYLLDNQFDSGYASGRLNVFSGEDFIGFVLNEQQFTCRLSLTIVGSIGLSGNMVVQKKHYPIRIEVEDDSIGLDVFLKSVEFDGIHGAVCSFIEAQGAKADGAKEDGKRDVLGIIEELI